MMQITGDLVGFALANLAAISATSQLALVTVTIVELMTIASVVLRVGPGLPPKPREGRSLGRCRRATLVGDVHPRSVPMSGSSHRGWRSSSRAASCSPMPSRS